jgi:acyl carrier protein
MSAIYDQVAEQLCKELKLDISTVEENVALRGLPGADSVRLVRVVALLERQFDVEFDDESVFAVTTIGDLVALVSAHVTEGRVTA